MMHSILLVIAHFYNSVYLRARMCTCVSGIRDCILCAACMCVHACATTECSIGPVLISLSC